ncbi:MULTISPECIES: hypothetical protein [Streptomyces]|uniref:Uncharacterized protein n=2 Tax=Streptomyces TaxID=1883 RepID=A0ABV9IZN9_9ACTN
MHTYEVPRRQVYQSVPSARPAQDSQGGPSATPIYDTLYAEYVKTFRSLPGDRSGEDDLGFTAFGNIPHSTVQTTGSGYRPGSFSHAYSAYSAGAQSARQGLGQQSQWQRVGQLGPVPAALPPGPRRSF